MFLALQLMNYKYYILEHLDLNSGHPAWIGPKLILYQSFDYFDILYCP